MKITPPKLYPQKGGKYIYLVYTVTDPQTGWSSGRQRLTFKSESEAMDQYAVECSEATRCTPQTWQAAKDRAPQSQNSDVPTSMTVSQYLDMWMSDGMAHLKSKSAQNYIDAWNKLSSHVGPNRHMVSIGRHDIDSLVSSMAKSCKPQTVSNMLRGIKRGFALAVEWGALQSNPTIGVRSPRFQKKVAVALPLSEIANLVQQARRLGEGPATTRSSAYLYPCIVLAVFCGLRRGELQALLWNDIDMENGVITVCRSAEGASKNYEVRYLGMTDDVRAALTWWRAWWDRFLTEAVQVSENSVRTSQQEDGFRRIKIHNQLCPAKDRLVFPSFSGETLQIGKTWRLFAQNVLGRTGTHFHHLRDSFAVMAAENGVSILELQKAMGHSSPKTTEIYLKSKATIGINVASKMPILSEFCQKSDVPDKSASFLTKEKSPET